MAPALQESFEIACPALERQLADPEAESMDLTRDFDYSFLFLRGKKSLADSDTITTCANSSFANYSYLNTSFAIHERPQKCVRFAFDKDDDVMVEEFEAEGPLTDEEKVSMWWQPLEFKIFRRYCKKAAEIARKSKYVNEFTRVYDACSAKHLQDVTELCHISRVHVRGLELVVFPTLCRARKLVIRGVVQTQDRLPDGMDVEERAKILAATSKCLTGRARMLARVLGVGDEEVAKECSFDDE